MNLLQQLSLCCVCRAPASLVVRHSSLQRKKSNLHFSPRGEAKWVRGLGGGGVTRGKEDARAAGSMGML